MSERIKIQGYNLATELGAMILGILSNLSANQAHRRCINHSQIRHG